MAVGGHALRVCAAGVAVAAVLMSATPASADAVDEAFEALYRATQATATAARSGVDVVQSVRFSRSTDLSVLDPRVNASVAAGTRLRIHSTVDTDGTSYLSVRFQPSGRLLAGAGTDPITAAPWATLRMLRGDALAEARRAGLIDRTALTDVPVDAVLDSYVVEEPLIVALRLILPPYSGSGDEGWSTIEALPQPDGTTIIRGTIRAGVPASDGEDRCTRPLVELTVGPDDVARSSRWTEACPGEGTRTYRAVALYGPQDVQPPTRPRRAADAVLG